MIKHWNSQEMLQLGWRWALLMSGLFCYGLAICIMLKGGLGLSAWEVFHQGVSLRTALSYGQAGQLTGLVIILVSFLMGIKPGVGTIANMFFIGFWVDLINQSQVIPVAEKVGGLPAQLIWVLASMFILGLGSGMYIKAGMGAGPRDSFMLALVKRTGWRVWICRAIMEISVCTAGWLLGGSVGIGTVLIAFGVGPAVELGFKICRVKVERGTPARSMAEAEPVSLA